MGEETEGRYIAGEMDGKRQRGWAYGTEGNVQERRERIRKGRGRGSEEK
jgi:hypothetical protein